jgi:hypothetical protein
MRKETTMTYRLVILSFEDRSYRHVVSERPTAEALDRIENGVNINLNHDEFYTEIEEVDGDE